MFISPLFFILPLISATSDIQTLGTFPQGKCINLLQLASSSIGCNITSVTQPNSTRIIGIFPMDKTGDEYNYTFCRTSILGDYIVNGECWNSTVTVWAYDFQVTVSGYQLTTSHGILYLVTIFILAIFTGLSFYLSIRIPFKNHRGMDDKIVSINDLKYVKLFLIASTYVMFMFLTAVLYSLSNNFLYLNGISNIFYWMYRILLAMMYPAIVLSLLFTAIIFINDVMTRRLMKRNLFIR